MNVTIVGAGYVGLVTGLCLADRGHRVTCVDVDAGKVARLNDGVLPIHEAGLGDLLERHLGSAFFATTELGAAVRGSELTIIAVGTPLERGAIDLRFVSAAASAIGRALATASDYHVVVVKSTVVPGTTDELVGPAVEQASGKTAGREFGLGMNPEFLREGEAVEDFRSPDRIVLGAADERSLEVMKRLYAGFDGTSLVCTNPRTAEMIKYASNSLFATLISFSNEIGNLCAAAPEVDVLDVLGAVHLDKRISPIMGDGERVVPPVVSYLRAGCGFGGSCFPKDVNAIVRWAADRGRSTPVLRAVLETNEEQPREIIRLLERQVPNLAGARVAVLGLAFKPGTDDIRESPALRIVTELVSRGASVVAYDPIASGPARQVLGSHRVEYAASLASAIEDVDAVVLVTAWPEFQQLPALLEKLDRPPILIDGRRVLDRTRIPGYEGIGLHSAGSAGFQAETTGAAI